MEEILRVSSISKKFKEVVALNNVSLKIKKNTIFGLLGSNGAGKTTLLHIIIRLLKPSDGRVFIFGNEITNKYSSDLKRRISIVPQKISLYDDLTIYENLYFFGKAYKLEKEEIIEKIEGFSSILKLGDLNRKVKNLSGGYQRRTSLAVGLMGSPEILILDEALVGIDLETKNIIIDLLSKLKKNMTIILTTHSIREAEELCDNICFLHKGKKVLDGETKKIISDYAANHESTISIKFKNEQIAEKIYEKIRSSKRNIKRKESTILIKTLPNEDPALTLLYLIKKLEAYDQFITDVSIHKPNLEEIMLNLIKSD